jgi:hypothetical protein
MIELTRRIRERLLDATDLLIDFLTLGEYGLERAAQPVCEARVRSAAGGAAIDRGQHLTADLDRPLQRARI